MDELAKRIEQRLIAAADAAERAGLLPPPPEERGHGLAVEGWEYGDPLILLTVADVARIAADEARATRP
ncbi:hypothetical protein HH310_12635 [Actinoplanes sp. TBRC 11911]|uniref:hypothetical protein n=1 Tax=Actinoplanes sp. TBRC 11911 TaxID=2729386 RepID=UPI00145D1C0B|nr:hypothetical protein [Actinoplanes sp. TBRC 11911]NMO52040.1 hypothetical protein [Actinoplanes sp. TBRC 11911]